MTEPAPRPLELPPATGEPRLDALARLVAIVDRLRAPDGCPWDREQTIQSMAPSLIEEAFEAVEAIEEAAGGSSEAALQATAEELGDLALVIVLIARIAQDEGRFDLATAATAVGDKLIRRHPHVFGDTQVDGAAHVLANWERIKQAERSEKKEDTSVLAGVPRSLPALQRAQRIVSKAMAAGFRWSDAEGAFAKVQEETAEFATELRSKADPERLEEELGDVLFATAILGVYLELDPERAVRGAVRRFEERFRDVEGEFGESLRDRSLEELMAAWERAKQKAH